MVNKGDVIFALTGDPVSKQNANSWVGRVSLYTHDIPAYLNQRTCKIIQCNNVIMLSHNMFTIISDNTKIFIH